MSCNWSVDLCSPKDFMGKIRIITAYLLGQGRSTCCVWNKPWNSNPKRYCRLTTPKVMREARTVLTITLDYTIICLGSATVNRHFLLRTLTTEICLFCWWQLELVNKFHNRSSKFTTSVCCWSDGMLCFQHLFRFVHEHFSLHIIQTLYVLTP